MSRKVTLDLLKLGLTRAQWRALRAEAAELRVPIENLVEVIVQDWLRRERRRPPA